MLALFSKDMVPNCLFLTLFLRHLPANIRDQLATQDLLTPEAMAVGANCIFIRLWLWLLFLDLLAIPLHKLQTGGNPQAASAANSHPLAGPGTTAAVDTVSVSSNAK